MLKGVPPRYPEELRAANIEGVVHAQFVVDTTGKADLGSFKAKQTTHEAFVKAVKEALEQMTFSPAEVNGRKVRQLLDMPFAFSLSR
jgi:protein TonB